MTAQPDDSATPWRIQGDWWDLCNCDIGCPCIFGSAPTQGYCESVLTYIIREGTYGDVDLSGLAVVLIVYFEGTVFDVNREFGFIMDDRADVAQREALEIIFTGRAGGIFGAMRDMTIKLHGVEFMPMTVSQDAENWKVEVPGLVDGLGGPYRRYRVPDDDTCRVYNAPRPEVVPGFVTLGHAIRNIVTGAFGRNWDLSGKSAKHIGFDLSGPDSFGWRN